jgi:hypothetical protein
MKKWVMLTIIGVAVLAALILAFGVYYYRLAAICVNAGEINSNPSSSSHLVKCCVGLRPVYTGMRYLPENELADGNGCISSEGFPSVCSDCGNGNCESWENICNCQVDCINKE